MSATLFATCAILKGVGFEDVGHNCESFRIGMHVSIPHIYRHRDLDINEDMDVCTYICTFVNVLHLVYLHMLLCLHVCMLSRFEVCHVPLP